MFCGRLSNNGQRIVIEDFNCIDTAGFDYVAVTQSEYLNLLSSGGVVGLFSNYSMQDMIFVCSLIVIYALGFIAGKQR